MSASGRKKSYQIRQLTGLQRSLIILSLVGTCMPWHQPWAEAAANTITPNAAFDASKVSSKIGTTVTVNGKVTDVTTNKIVTKDNVKTAINVFDKYQVGTDNVVNMYFGDKKVNDSANLVNLVKDKIDVNGTVNAIQNNKIGGNMYFLSSNGIAVGASGVINTGSLYLMTPTELAMSGIVNFTWLDGEINESGLQKVLTGDLALNHNATITMSGKINANNNVLLAAGRSVTTDPGSEITTGVTNFGDLVNLSGQTGYENLVNGSKNLTAVGTDGGNITLLAQNSGIVNSTETNLSATVTNKGSLKAAGGVNVSAVASSEESQLTSGLVKYTYNAMVDQVGDITSPGFVNIQAISNSYERLADKTAQIDVSGKVTGGKVNIAASSVNAFVDAASLDLVGAITEAVGALSGIEFDADYSVVKNTAVVNIKDSAVITATSAPEYVTDKETQKPVEVYGLNISAGAGVTNSLGSSSSLLRLNRGKNAITSALPAASVTYLTSDNTANVNIDGTLKAKGLTTIKASADSYLETGAAVGTVDLTKTGDIALASIDFTKGTNNALVNISEKAKLDQIEGAQNLTDNLVISADTINQVTARSESGGNTSSLLSSAVNVVDYTSDAQVNVKSAVTAKSVTIKAADTVAANTMVTSNNVSDVLSGSFSKLFLKSQAFDNLVTNIFGSLKVEGADSALKQLGKYASIGVSVGVANESFTAGVAVSPQAKVTGQAADKTKGDVTLAAVTTIKDTAMQTLGNMVAGAKSGQQVGVEAAVQVVNLHNDSTVTLEGAKEANAAQVSGKNVTLKANSTMEYVRPQNACKSIVACVKAIGKAFTEEGSTNKADLDTLNSYITALEASADKLQKMDFTADNLEAQGNKIGSAHQDFLSQCTEVGAWLDKHPVAIYNGVEKLYKSLIALLSPNTYANFAVATTNKDGSSGKNTKLDISGAVNVNHVYNDSRVLVGRGAQVTAAETLTAAAASTAENVSYTGDSAALFLPNTSKGSGGGASVAAQLFDNNSLVLVAEGAALTGDNVTLTADDSLMQTGVVFSSGDAKGAGVHGMVNYLGGSSSSVVSVDDEAKLTAKKNAKTGALTLSALNDSTLVNIAGGFSKAQSVSVGASAGVTEYDLSNYAAVGDNDADGDRTQVAGDTAQIKTANKVKQAATKALSLSGLTEEQQKDLLGSKAAVLTGGLTGADIKVTADTTGAVNTIGVAGSLTSASDTGGGTTFDNILGWLGKNSGFIANPVTQAANVFNAKAQAAGQAANAAGQNNVNMNVNNNNLQPEAQRQEMSKFHVDVAGSGAMNLLSGDTAALVDSTSLTINEPAGTGTVQTEADDKLFVGAWAGAAAVNYVQASQGGGSKASVGVSGAIAYNGVNRDVFDAVSQSTVTDAKTFNNAAYKKGAEVAAGLGAAVSVSKDKSNYTVAAALSLNEVNSEVDAYLVQDVQTVSSSTGPETMVRLVAENTDTQVTGGVDLSVALGSSGTSIGGGLALGIANLNNNVHAGVIGGNYNKVDSLTEEAVLATKQITTGLGVAVATTSGESFSGALDGALTVTTLNNDTRADLTGAEITTGSSAGRVEVRAYDKNPGDSEYTAFLKNRGLDANGTSYLNASKKSENNQSDANEAKALKEADPDGNRTDYTGAVTTAIGKTGEAGGNLIVNTAIAAAATSGKGAEGLGLNIAVVNNDYNAVIDGATISAGRVEAGTQSDTVVVALTAGASGSTKRETSFTGAGALGVVTLDEDLLAQVKNSTLKTDQLAVNAVNNNTSVNINGQLTVGSVGAGLTFGWTQQDNTVRAQVLGSTLDPRQAEDAAQVNLFASNDSGLYNIGVGTAVSTDKTALNGNVVVNTGSNQVEALVDNLTDDKGTETRHTKLNKVKQLNVTAEDKTTETGVAAGAAAGKGTVTLGGAIAYSDIGGSSTKTTSAKQQLTAAVKNTDITTRDGSAVTVKATDTAHVTDVAVGLSASNKAAVEGTAAVSLINKTLTSSLESVNLIKETGSTKGAAVEITADSSDTIGNAAVVIAAAGKAGVGAGVAVNRINAEVNALISQSTLNVKSAQALAQSRPDILDIGIGIGAGGTAGVAGSFGVNLTNVNTTSKVNDSTIKASGSVGALAVSDERVRGYGGTIGGAGTGAAALSTTVSVLDGNTQALVNDSFIYALGQEAEGITVQSDIKDENLDKGIVNGSTFTGNNLKDKRQSKTIHGLVVDASSTHSVTADLASVGGAGTFELMGTVNVNSIGGSTTAKLTAETKGEINNGSTGAVAVKAADYAYEAAFVGEAGGSGTAAIGAASDTELLTRNVTAAVEGVSDTNRLQITAGSLNVDAVNKQGVSTLLIGAQGSGVAAIAAGVSVVKLSGTTSANWKNLNVGGTTSAGLNGYHFASLGEGNNNFAGSNNMGVGATVSVIVDESEVDAKAENTKLASTGAVIVQASDKKKVLTENVGLGLAFEGVGAAANVAVNNFEDTVKTSVLNSDLSGANVEASALNDINVSTNGGTLGAAAVGVGASVVVNTINSSTGVDVIGSNLTADGAVKVQAQEDRTVKGTVVNLAGGIGGIGVNVFESTVGKKLTTSSLLTDNSWQDTINKGLDQAVEQANKVQTDGESGDPLGHTNGLSLADQTKLKKEAQAQATQGSGKSNVHAVVTGGKLAAEGDANVTSLIRNHTDISGGSGALSGISANVGVTEAVLNNNLSTKVSGATLTGKNVTVKAYLTDLDGQSQALSGQGNLGLLNLSASVAKISSYGAAQVEVDGSTLHGVENVNIASQDSSSISAKSYGVSAGALNFGTMLSFATNEMSTEVALGQDDQGTANKISAGTAVAVDALRNGKVDAYTLGGSNIGPSVSYIDAESASRGDSKLMVTGSGAVYNAPVITLNALNAPVVSAESFNETVSVAAVQVSASKGTLKLNTDLGVESGNTFTGNQVDFKAGAGAKDQLTNRAKTRGVNVTMEAATPNWSEAESETTVNVAVGKETYKTDASGNGLTVLTVAGLNNLSQSADTDLVTVGAIWAVADGRARVKGTNTITVDAQQGGTVGSLKAGAHGISEQSAEAKGDGGGLFNISPYAAYAESNLTNTLTTNLGGQWIVTGEAQIGTLQDDTLQLYVDTDNGGLVNVAGDKAVNNVTDTSKLNILDGTELTANSLYGISRNILISNKKDITAEGVAGGLGAGNNISSESDIKNTAQLNLGQVKVTTTNSQTWEAYNNTKLKNNVKAISGGLAAGSVGDSTNKINLTEKVLAGKGTQLNVTRQLDADGTVNAVTLAASDNVNLTAATTASTGGGVAGVTAKSDNTTIRNAYINADGTIYSAGDVNLYAGVNGKGSASSLTADLEANAYTYALIPIPLTSFANRVTENNQVTVGVSGVVNAIRNINLTGASGSSDLKTRTVQYTWYAGDKEDRAYVGSKNGQPDFGQVTDNYVLVDGKLNAGLENEVTIEISGKKAPHGTTFADGTEGGYSINVVSGPYTKDIIAGGITQGYFNYANALYTRYMELGKLIDTYQVGTADNLTAYYGYKAEQQSILEQMIAQKMVEPRYAEGDTGHTTIIGYNPIESIDTNYISLPDITVGGGNVVITSNNLGGSGSLKADGSPAITVKNASDAFLKVGSLTVGGDEGGQILYQNQNIAGFTNEAIHKLNKDSARQTDFAKFPEAPAASSSAEALISVTTKYEGGSYQVADTQTENVGQTATYDPLTTIQVGGLLTNNLGQVDVINESGDITIQAAGKHAKAGVVASTVNIQAAGSVNQGYVDGIVNIGLTPEVTYKDFAKTHEGKMDVQKLENKKVTSDDLPAVSDSGTWIAGGSVYISASDINVNGLVQSGYENYGATIEADALTPAKLSTRPQTMVNGVYMYKLNDGGKAVYNATTKAFDYLAQVYYDPATGRILVEDISTSGGSIYLTGNLSSTGGGSLLAADGGADIKVINNTTAAMDVGRILNNDRTGKITLTDVNLKKQTIFTKAGTTVIDLNKKSGQEGYSTASGPQSSYKVKSGLRYNWTDGTENTTRKTYEKTVDNSWWGLGSDVTTEELKNYESNTKPTHTQEPVPGAPKQPGTYIGTVDVDGVKNDQTYALIYDNVEVSENRSETEKWTTSSGFLGFNKHHHYRWTTTEGTSQTYVNSIKADYDIGIKFIGQAGDITVTGGGDVALNGNLKSYDASSKINVTAGTQGSGGINQVKNVYLSGNNINLAAQDDITGIKVTSLALNSGAGAADDLVNLNAVSQKGMVDVAVSGGVNGKTSLPGKVNVIALKGDTSVKLNATGDITQSTDQLTVKADKITLISTRGALGTALQPLVVEGGQNATGDDRLSASVNAGAKGDIYLTQDSGDMRIGNILSSEGSVTLKAENGDFIDALPNVGTNNNTDIDAMVQRWKDMGLIEGEGTFTTTLAADRLTYQTQAEEAFEQYKKLESQNDPLVVKSASYQQLQKQFTDPATGSDFASAAAYLARDQKYQKLMAAPVYEWTKEALLYAIKDAVINKKVGSTDNEKKAANVSGKNIILTGRGVGTNDEQSVVIDLNKLTENDLKTLANANAADVSWDQANHKATITGKRALGVAAAEQVTLNVSQDAYISSRALNLDQATGTVSGNADGSGPKLTLNKITATGDVRILGKQGVAAGSTDTTRADITANGLYIEGGNGAASDIGTSNRYLLVNTTATAPDKGQVSAIAGGSIYLRGMGSYPGSMYLGTMYAGKDIYVDGADRQLEMSSLADAMAYIRAGGTVNLFSSGALGTKTDPLRLYNGNAAENVINLSNNGDIYLKGMNGAEPNGIMSIGSVVSAGGEVDLTSEGRLIVGKEDTSATEQDGFAGMVKAAKNVSLNAVGDVVLDGPVIAGSGSTPGAAGTVTITSTEGSLQQLDAGNVAKAITAQKLVTVSAKGQDLQNIGNDFSQFSFDGALANASTITGDVLVKTTAQGGLILDGNNAKVDGDVKPVNSVAAASLTINTGFETINGHDINLSSGGQLTNNGKLLSGGDLTLTSTSADLVNNGTADAKGLVTLKALQGSVTNEKSVLGGTGIIMEGLQLTNKGFLASGGDINLTGTNGIENQRSIISTGGSVQMNSAQGDIVNTKLNAELGVIEAKQDIGMTADRGSILVEGKLKSGGNTSLAARGDGQAKPSDLTVVGDIDSQGKVTLSTQAGSLDVNGNITGQDDVQLSSQSGAVGVNGNITGQDDVQLGSQSGAVGVNGNITGQNDVQLSSQSGNIKVQGTVKAKQDAEVSSGSGQVAVDGAVAAERDALISSDTGTVIIGLDGVTSQDTDVSAGRDMTIKTGNDTDNSNIFIYGNVQGKGAASLTTKKGTIAVLGDVTSGSGDLLMASTVEGDIINKGVLSSSGANVQLTTTKGSIWHKKDITAAKDVILDSQADLEQTGNIESGGSTSLNSQGKIDLTGNIKSGAAASLESGGDTKVTGSINSEGGVQVTAHKTGTIAITGDVTGKEDVRLTTENTNLPMGTSAINNTGSITSEAGSVSVTAGSGDVKILDTSGLGTIKAKLDATVATTNGEVAIDGAVAAERDVTIKSDTGKLTIGLENWISQDTDLSAGRNLTLATRNENSPSNIVIFGNTNSKGDTDMSTHQGNIIVIGGVSAGGQVNLKSLVKGNILNSGTINSVGSDVNISSQDGDFVNGKDITAANGSVRVDMAQGKIGVEGRIEAGQAVDLTAAQDITTNGNVKAGGDINQTVTGDGTVINGDGINAGGSLTEKILGKGDLNINKSVRTGQDLNLIANNGSVNLDLPDISIVGRNINLSAKQGDANLKGYMGVGHDTFIEAVNGDVNFSGVLLDPDRDSSLTLQTTNGNINNEVSILTAGSIKERVLGQGDINNAKNLFAGGDVDLQTDKGNITVKNETPVYARRGTITLATGDGRILARELNGENVGIYLGTNDSYALVGTTTVGQKLSFEGSNFLNAQINQREDYTNPLHISAVGAGGRQPMEYFLLVKIDAPNGIIMDKLWSKTAFVNAKVPELQMDALRIEKTGYFFTPATQALVYGPQGAYDRSESRQFGSVHACTSSHPWMQLYLKENGSQFSDGILLARLDEQRVDNQRYSAVDWSMHLLENEMARKMYDKYTSRSYPGDSYGNYWRYDLVDYRDLLQ